MKEKIKEFYESYEVEILLATSAVLVTTSVIGAYILGARMEKLRIDIGLARTLERHPELEKPLLEAVAETLEYYCY